MGKFSVITFHIVEMDNLVQPLSLTTEDAIICSFCNAKFKSKYNMEKHVKTKHIGIRFDTKDP